MGGRNISVEMYQILLVFGICLLHSITFSNHVERGLDNVLLSCVDGFVLISGYYGMKFKVVKVVRLLCITAWCSLVAMGLNKCLFQAEFSVHVLLKIILGHWFLWAYLVVMLLSPLLNVTTIRAGGGILFGVFIWSYLTQVEFLHPYIPKPIGFVSMGSATKSNNRTIRTVEQFSSC